MLHVSSLNFSHLVSQNGNSVWTEMIKKVLYLTPMIQLEYAVENLQRERFSFGKICFLKTLNIIEIELVWL